MLSHSKILLFISEQLGRSRSRRQQQARQCIDKAARAFDSNGGKFTGTVDDQLSNQEGLNRQNALTIDKSRER